MLTSLKEYIEEKQTQKFEWGVCDCTLFTGDWCEKAVGKNPAQGAHGQYHDKKTAYVYLKKR